MFKVLVVDVDDEEQCEEIGVALIPMAEVLSGAQQEFLLSDSESQEKSK